MKWILTLYVCSVLSGECFTPTQDTNFSYEKEYNSHYECVRNGLGDSYEFLFASGVFNQEQIEKFKIYPKFTCITEKENKQDA